MAEDTSDFPWHLGVFDAHCHPTDTMSTISSIAHMKARVLTVMATRAQDQELVSSTANEIGLHHQSTASLPQQWEKEAKIIPAFGWHPWFSYQMFDPAAYNGAASLNDVDKIAHYQSVLVPKSDDKDFLLSLPDPKPFTHFLAQTKEYLEGHPLALVGEIGLDKVFRLPEAWIPKHQDNRDDALTPGGREGRQLSQYRVSMEHQRHVLKAQLHLAGEMKRAVSVHGVQVHGVLFDALSETWKGYERKVLSKRERKEQTALQDRHADIGQPIDHISSPVTGPKPYPPRICLHSFSGHPEQAKQYLNPTVPAEIYFSFSEVINFDKPSTKAADVIKMLPNDKILVESDLHTAGDRMDDYLEDIVRRICDIKGWPLVDGVNQLANNWKRFAFGTSELT
jgi:Tat protein secretion system quality control protein TatD with DNase activity